METVVIALGGNAIIKAKQFGAIAEQFENTRDAIRHLVPLWQREDENFLITHGNGPQVGNVMIRVEASRDKAYDIPLGVAVAQTQGEMGYMIAQVCQNQIDAEGMDRKAVCVLTQALCDPDDPQMLNPTKPIGPFYHDDSQVQKLRDMGHSVVEDAGRGWRRVVPSPRPTAIVEADAIRTLLDKRYVVIACGGGGMPVYRHPEDGRLEGIDGVIDKDLATALLANEVGARRLVIITGVEKVAIGFNTPQERWLDELHVDEAIAHHAHGEFPPGNMGPKIEAAIQFLKDGGNEVIITDIDHIVEALDGKTGTRITR
jgi:carbamate kinase